MEVHPPEHPIFTWKQFFIHMTTVCLGLLIALGLEQDVEALHRHHQRHQLEADLRAEGVRNLHYAITALQFSDWMARRHSQQAQELDRAAAQGRTPAYVPELPGRPRHFGRPSDAAWTVAQTSTTLNLLPRSEAERYAHPYFDVQMATEQLGRLNELLQERQELLDVAAVDPHTGLLAIDQNATYDLSRLSKEQLARFREITGNMIVASRSEASYSRDSWPRPGSQGQASLCIGTPVLSSLRTVPSSRASRCLLRCRWIVGQKLVNWAMHWCARLQASIFSHSF